MFFSYACCNKKTDIYYSNRTRIVSLATLVVGSFCQQSALTWSAGDEAPRPRTVPASCFDPVAYHRPSSGRLGNKRVI